jgi:hypothetical protein
MRIFLGWKSYNNQMELMHNALSELDCKADLWHFSSKNGKSLCFSPSRRASVNIAINLLLSPFIVLKLIAIAIYYQHFFFFNGKTLLPIPLRWPFLERLRYTDLPLLKFLGKKISVVFQGTDVRDYLSPRYLWMAKEAKDSLDFDPKHNRIKHKVLKKAFLSSDSIVVSTLDLIDDIPEDFKSKTHVFFRAITPRELTIQAPLAHEKTRIIHAIVSAKYSKGSDLICDAMEHLTKTLPLEFFFLQNQPKDQLMQLARTCHVAIDQLFAGSYGVFALEMLALGLPVMGYISPAVREYARKMYTIEIPILQVMPENCEQAIAKHLSFLMDRSYFASLQGQIKCYLHTIHSKANSCRCLKPLIN